MKEQQLTIDDYNNKGELKLEPVMTSVDTTADRLEPESVDYNSLTKAELLQVVTVKDQAVKNYESKLETLEEKHTKELQDMAEYFKQEIDTKIKIIAYYERKFKLLSDILHIEKGDE